MLYEVVMPQYGLTMEGAKLVQWYKQPGEPVQRGEPLFAIETDKVTADIESPHSGKVVELLTPVDESVPVGKVIAKLELSEAEAAAAQAEPAARRLTSPVAPEPSSQPPSPEGPRSSPGLAADRSPAAQMPRGKQLASPRAKKLAREMGVDIQEVSARTGKDRLVEADIRRFAEEHMPASATTAVFSAGVFKEPASAVRRAIAQRMATSFREVPHFYLDRMADATELTKLRQTLFPAIDKETGVHLTITDVLLKAMALSLSEHPEINASWQEDSILHHRSIDIGVAVQTESRLLVVAVRDVDQLSLVEVGRRRSELVAKAKSGKLTVEDLEGGCATLSNLGSYGVDQFHAIISSPQSVTLAVGRIATRPVVVDESVVACPTVNLSLSVDHRLIDGVTAAGFLSSIVKAIESPYVLLLR